MNKIKLSIIVPCYNVELYLQNCLDSLIAQTMHDFEIIAVNDGSTDNTINILREYTQKYPSLITVIDQLNAGVWNARLAGINKANGEFIGFIDGDDTAEADFVETLVTAAENQNADVAVCGFTRIDANTGKVLSREFCEERPPFTITEDPGRLVELNGALWNKIFRAYLIKKSFRLDNPPVVLEDLVLALLALADAEDRIVFVPKSLVNYYAREKSAISATDTGKFLNARKALLHVRRYYQAKNADKALLEALDAVAFLHLGISLPFRLSYRDEVNLSDTLSDTTEYLNKHFPTWSRSPYICLSYVRSHNRAFYRLLLAQWIYKAHLMQPALAAYRFLINKLNFDLKW